MFLFKKLIKNAILPSVCVSLIACQPKTDNTEPQTIQASQTAPQTLEKSEQAQTAKPTTKQNQTIDWQKIDSGERAIDPTTFSYPFELDSEPVKIYAKTYQIDNQSARYQMTVGMAINELLSKLLDQLGVEYVSHEIAINDKKSAVPVLVVHTTKAIEPSEGEYVFADKFAKGLTIKVKIINDGIKKSVKNPHENDE